jgi:hypothetical protein
MKRAFYALLRRLRERAAIRAYRHCSKRTSDLFASYNTIGAELRTAIEAETAAANRMERLLNSNS